jgi:hypothetical protein
MRAASAASTASLALTVNATRRMRRQAAPLRREIVYPEKGWEEREVQLRRKRMRSKALILLQKIWFVLQNQAPWL